METPTSADVGAREPPGTNWIIVGALGFGVAFWVAVTFALVAIF